MPTAYENFEKTLKRSNHLLDLYNTLHDGRMKNTSNFLDKRFCHDDISDLLRSAIVLSVSAMDAYFTDKFTEKFIPHLKKHGPSKELIKLLNEAGFDTKLALSLLNKDETKRPLRKLRTLLDGHLEKHITQDLKKADELFASIGIGNLSKNAAWKAQKRDLLPKIIKSVVERRHKIVHSGDLNSHGKPNKIAYKWAKRGVDHIGILVEQCELIINKSIK